MTVQDAHAPDERREREETELPMGVGRVSRGWIAFVGLAFLGVVVGIIGFLTEQGQGLVGTGMRDLGTMGGATWGLYITLVIYFVGVSFAGIMIAALIRLFNLEHLKGIARMAEVMTVVALLLGALAIIVDLGKPVRGVVNLFRYARPQSPFFGTFSLVITGYLFSSLVYMYVTARRDAAVLAARPSKLQGFFRAWSAGYEDTADQRARDRRTTFWLALAILPVLVVATSSLGLVFGLQVGRPGWFGTLQAPAFVVLAGVSGIGHIIVLAAIVRHALHQEDRIGVDAFAWLGRFLMTLLFVYCYFVAVEIFTTIYQPAVAEQRIGDALLTGRYAWLFWGSIVTLVVPALLLAWMAIKKQWRIGWLVAIGVIVNLGALAKRYLIVVPSQTHGQLLPYGEVGTYSPTWVEYAVMIGLFSLGALLVAIFMKIFPIIELADADTDPDVDDGGAERPEAHEMEKEVVS
ncbi:MAG: polysulfide reductase NrfD [Ilumatobacter sp.]|nr:polysulfide reductase NrfD [Ilumatobacter sp.]